MKLKDSIVVITGASSGIGAAAARELARQGAVVVLAARRADDLTRLADEIVREGGRALAIPTDISRYADIQTLFEKALAAYGRVDILINNAGIGGGKPLAEMSDVALENTVAVNLIGPARCARAAIPQMRRQGSGLILNIGSVAGEVATLGIYSATKFGLRGLNDALRRELWQDNIDVVLIAPGFIQTPMTSGLKIPMPGPEAVVNAILSAIRRPRRKIVVPWIYRLLMYFGKLTPWLVDRIIGSDQGRKAYTERN